MSLFKILMLAAPGLVLGQRSLTALTFNIAGLPEFLQGNGVPGDKTENTKIIGASMAAHKFDFINVQEDFNYHAALYEADNHKFRTATSGGVPFGSGLNTLSNFDFGGSVERITWDKTSIGSADGLTPKGFTMVRAQVDSAIIDVYNLHADAGSDDGDKEARAANIAQVVDYISANSVGNAVIVMGDTNSRYTRTGDGIRLFSSTTVLSSPLTDAWVELAKGGVEPVEGSEALLCDMPQPATNTTCEIVDKVLYRSGDTVKLTAKSFEYAGEKFLQPDGNPTSDHNPILVTFDLQLA